MIEVEISSKKKPGTEDREDLLERFRTVRRTTEWLCEPLTSEDCVVQTAMECSPVKWQLAHVSWFFEQFVLSAFDKRYRIFHDKYAYLFNSYYNTIGDRTPRPERGLMSRPTVEEVKDYRRYVEEAIEHFLLNAGDATMKQALPIFILGLNHEQQHQELIVTDVKTVLAMNPLRPIYRSRTIERSPIPSLRWIEFDEGIVEIGAKNEEFYFDNEGPRHRQYLESFALSDRLVTNREYKEFMHDGGYQNSALWLSDGFAKCEEESWLAPKYWEQHDGEWWHMTLQGFRPVEDSEPVTHISHYEADAYATWAGVRLATEFEWEHGAHTISTEDNLEGNFLDDANFHPIPDADGNGLRQMFGDVWEWTRSAYLPYPRYKPVEGALGEYNGKFMSNQMVLRGGSCATPRDHIRSTYRNFFPPESRWQFSGIRLAKDI